MDENKLALCLHFLNQQNSYESAVVSTAQYLVQLSSKLKLQTHDNDNNNNKNNGLISTVPCHCDF